MTPPPSPSSPAPLSPAPFTAQLLKTGASGLAALATERLMQERPTLAQRYAPNAKIKWRDNISARIGYLAAAVTTGKAEVFMHHTGWDKVAHASRGGAEACADLEASMHALRQTLSAELPAHASGPALTMLDRAIEHLVRAPTELASSLKAGTTTGRLAAEYLIAVLEGDRHRASMLVLDAVRGTRPGTPILSVSQIYTEVLGPVQLEMGRMWHMNESTVAEEHFTTATTHMVISMLYPYLPRKAWNGKTALCASVETNAHDIGVRMVADFLEMDGWRSVYLGANVPIDDLVLAVDDFRVDLVCLSASLATHIPLVADAIKRIRAGAQMKAVKILVGGGAFVEGARDVYESLGADGFAADPTSAVLSAARLTGGGEVTE